MQKRSNCRECEQGNRVEQEHRSERDGDLFFIGVGDGRDGGDGAAAADRRAGGDEERDSLFYFESLPRPQPRSMAMLMLAAV